MKRLAISLLACALAACAIGPDYERPSAPVPAAYKEAARTGDAVWLPAAPADTLARGDWWRLFGDAELDRLAAEVDAANQTIAAAVASYTQAQALVREARAAYYPRVGIDISGRRFGGGNGSAGSTGAPAPAPPTPSPPRCKGRLGTRLLGPRLALGRSRARRRARQRRRPRRGAPVGARRAGDRLLRAARVRLRGRAAGANDRRLRARAGDHAEPLCRRRRRQDRRAAGADPAVDDARVADDGARQSRALRARDRRPHGQGTGRFRARTGAVERPRAGDPARRAVDVARAPARHRCGRTPGGRRQRPDRRRAVGVLPEPDAERVGRHGRPALRRSLQRRQPALVVRRRGRTDRVRRRRDQRARRGRRRRARSHGGALSPDRPHRLPGRRGPAQQRARAGRAGRLCSGRPPTPPTRSSSRS